MTPLLANNIYILDSKIKLPMDILNYIKYFIGNPLTESKKYRNEIELNNIINNLKEKEKEILIDNSFNRENREFNYYISIKITSYLINIKSYPTIESLLISLNKGKMLTNCLSKNLYHKELINNYNFE